MRNMKAYRLEYGLFDLELVSRRLVDVIRPEQSLFMKLCKILYGFENVILRDTVSGLHVHDDLAVQRFVIESYVSRSSRRYRAVDHFDNIISDLVHGVDRGAVCIYYYIVTV